jgi:hypothetical protein
MFTFTAAMSRKGGMIALFGDGDDGRVFRMRRKESPTDVRGLMSTGATIFSDSEMSGVADGFREQSLWLTGAAGFESFRRVKPGLRSSRIFREGGYAVLRGAASEVMVDVGGIGMDEGRGHGHVDTLSFEYSRDGYPLIVDSGTYCYTADIHSRERFRSVSAHNTVFIEGVEPISIKGLWRFGEDRTMPRVDAWSVDDDRTRLVASWHPNALGVVPRRHVRALEVVDSMNETSGENIIAAFHLHPDVVIESESKSMYIVSVGAQKFRISLKGGECSIEPSWYSPSYGVKNRSYLIRLKWSGHAPFRAEMRLEPAT